MSTMCDQAAQLVNRDQGPASLDPPFDSPEVHHRDTEEDHVVDAGLDGLQQGAETGLEPHFAERSHEDNDRAGKEQSRESDHKAETPERLAELRRRTPGATGERLELATYTQEPRPVKTLPDPLAEFADGTKYQLTIEPAV